LVRSAGDNLVLAPAYVVEKAQIEHMVDLLAQAIKRAA
jgi:beta-alanine--pyruvate transaminase